MKTNRVLISFVVVALFLGILATVTPGSAVLAQDNLLANGSFEGGYSSYIPQTPEQSAACPVGECTTAQMPVGWFPWWVPQNADDEPWENRMPEYKPVCPFDPCPYPERLKDGPQAMQYFTFHGTHTAGLWQRVSVPANANLKFSAWGQAWSSASDATYSDFPTPVNMRIGIDPTGGTNPFSPAIVWTGFANPYDAYVPFEVDATAQGDTVTVFMWSQPQEARKHNDIYWDGASLVATGAGAPAPAPAPVSSGGGGAAASVPAPVFQLGPTPTPNAEGIIQVTVQPGDSLWAIAARAGLTLDEILEFNGLSRQSFINVGDVLIIGYGDAGAAPEEAAEESTEETAETTAEGGAPEGGEEAVEETAEAEESAGQSEVAAASAAVAAPIATTGEICLRAFDDTNGDGFFADGEPLKSDVAITIANGQSVISNYITNGSEPFCIDGLDSGNYQVSRSLVPGEAATNAAAWGVSLAPGMTIDIDFGSQIEAFDASAGAVAAADTAVEAEAANRSAEESAVDRDAAANAVQANEGSNLLGWVVGIILGIAVLLFLGIGFVVMSARRGTN